MESEEKEKFKSKKHHKKIYKKLIHVHQASGTRDRAKAEKKNGERGKNWAGKVRNWKCLENKPAEGNVKKRK